MWFSFHRQQKTIDNFTGDHKKINIDRHIIMRNTLNRLRI